MAKADEDEFVLEVENTPPPVAGGAPAWTMTFGDMMSLLLTFFILMFSMSEIKIEKFRAAAQSLHEGFGQSTIVRPELTSPDPVDSTPPPPPPPPPAATGLSQVEIDEAVDNLLDQFEVLLRNFVSSNELEEDIDVNRRDDAVVLSIRDVALFSPGEGFIDPANRWVVERLAQITSRIRVELIIAGHTDNIPIRDDVFRSNWELSAVRAAGIARLLVELGQPPGMIRAEGFAEFRPVASNEDEIGRSQNRRVELHYTRKNVMDAYVATLDAQAAPETEAAPDATPDGG